MAGPSCQPADTVPWKVNSRILSASRKALTCRCLPFALAALAVALTAPSLRQPWVADDLIHRKMLLSASLPALLRGLFVFVSPDESIRLADLSTELGTMPWWALDALRVSFFRPLAVLTHWLDYQLWPDSSVLMHAQSILWYGGVCALATHTYRRVMGPTWVAGLSALLFALDTVHLGSVAWLANRNGLLALLCGLLALVAHDRWRRERWRLGGLLAPLLLALALLSAETAVAAGAYLLGYAIFLDRGAWDKRLGSLVPYIGVAVVWRLVYQRLGYGAWGSGFYVDPVREPLRFAAAVAQRGPILLLSQWLGQVPVPYNLLSVTASRVAWAIALLMVVSVGLVLTPLVRRHREARFWTFGMLLSIIPACGISLLSGRLLLFSSIGAMGLMAQFIGGLFDEPAWRPLRPTRLVPARVLCFLLIGLHGLLPTVLMPAMSNVPDIFQRVIARVTDIGTLPDIGPRTVVIVNAPSPFHFIYLPSLRSHGGQPMPARVRVLAPGYFGVDVSRLDARTVVVRPDHGYLVPAGVGAAAPGELPPLVDLAYMYQHLEKFFRSDTFPMALGQRVELTGAHIEVTALSADGRPSEARIEFAAPLEDGSLAWLQWDWATGAYVPFEPPRIHDGVRIPGRFPQASGIGNE